MPARALYGSKVTRIGRYDMILCDWQVLRRSSANVPPLATERGEWCKGVRLLIVHLSDIHIGSPKDSVLGKAEKIASAVRSRNDSADLVLCVVSGDITFSGKAEQFELAREFFGKIAHAIGGSVQFALVPGNHDLDFERANAARDTLAKSVLQSPGDKIDPSIVGILATPQGAFFEFRDSMRDGVDLVGDYSAYRYMFNCTDGEQIVVRCVNTALLSSLKEKPASLVMASQIADDLDHSVFTVTTFHHPYNWLNPASKKIVRAIEDTSDIILTGHEHEHERTVKYKPESYTATTYIEAAALQEHSGADNSAFNSLLVDTKNGAYKFFHFEWDGERYSSASVVGDWEPLPLQALRDGGFADVTAEFAATLNDAGIPGEAKRRALSDVFLYPNLSESFRDPTLKQKRVTIKGENVFRTLKTKAVAFVSGLPKSGRTSLARKLFMDFSAEGYVPLLIDGAESGLRASDDLPPVVERLAKAQYGTQNLEAYVQLQRERRVILLDNAERAKGRRADRIKLIEKLGEFAGHVIVLGDDSAGGITEMDADEFYAGNEDRASYGIEEFNHGLREEFAQKWFGEEDLDEVEASRRLERAGQILDTVIGRSYVPAYPIYVMALLQAVKEGGAIDPKASTHGYFYDLLIRQALTEHSEAKDVGIRMAFLTHLASEMYAAGSRDILEQHLRESYRRYDEKYAVGGLEYGKLIAELVDRGMLTRQGDTVRFRYPYLYNYFVASHLARNIGSDEVRAEVRRLTENLGDDQATDILMFLAHLSHDAFIIESLLTTANGYLTQYEPETLDNVGRGTEFELAYVERETQGEARKALATRRDDQLSGNNSAPDEAADSESSKVGVEVLTALHTIRVMGQIVRNFPGVLTKEIKIAVLEASCGLGLRLLRLALEKVDVGRKELVERIVDVVRRLSPDMPDDKLKAAAEHYLWVLSIVTSYGILRGLSASMASQELQPIYDLVFAGKPTAAKKLINLSVRLAVSPAFPEGLVIQVAGELKGLSLAGLLAKLFVLNHFERIHVPGPKRQSICDRLGIRYQVLSSRKVVAVKRA
uniref:Uncharacterized protein n=1 Tax=mine drainage metagenome TaxID=410659 RepID=E6PEQ6_9ZZZZ